jgi:ribonuclease HI
VIQGPDGEGILEISSPIGYRTNNQAEYEALIRALKEAHRLGIGRLLVQTDSELLYYQWRGEYRVRDPELKRLQLRAQQIARGFKELTLRVIPRKENRLADRLAKDAAVR